MAGVLATSRTKASMLNCRPEQLAVLRTTAPAGEQLCGGSHRRGVVLIMRANDACELEPPGRRIVDAHEQNHQGPQEAGGGVPVGCATGEQPVCRPADDEPRRSLSSPGCRTEEEEQKEEMKCPIP